jgi:TP901 family phage tail tape measure protein
LPVVGIGVAALHMAGQFEQTMNVLQATTGASEEEMAALSQTAIALGSDLELPGTSAADAGEAMLELSRAGLSVQESMDAARGVLQLSAAAQISNAEAATITANALNTFGLAGSEAGRVANLLAGGANASSASITDMGLGMQMAGSVAASMGVPIEDLTTALALMANAGISGSDAGTSLKTMLMRLGAPTAEAAGLMDALGISIYDAQGTMLPMESIIDQFGGALAGMTMEQRNAALSTIFGSDAIRAANVVLAGGTEAWNAMETAVTAEGQAQALAAAQTAGFQGSLDGLRSVVETLLLTVAGPFLEMLTGWVQRLSSLVEWVSTLDPKLLNTVVVVAAIAAAIGPLLILLGSMASGLGIVAGALGLLLSPVGLVIAAIVALGVAVVHHFGGIQQTIQAASTFVQGVLAGLSAFVNTNQGEITGWVEQAWTQIQTIVTTLVTGVRGIVESVLGIVGQFIDQHGADIEAFVRRAWQQIGVIVNLALTLINEVVTRVLDAVKQFIDQHGTEILAILSTAWTMIRSMIQIALDLIEGILRVALAIIRGIGSRRGRRSGRRWRRSGRASKPTSAGRLTMWRGWCGCSSRRSSSFSSTCTTGWWAARLCLTWWMRSCCGSAKCGTRRWRRSARC